MLSTEWHARILIYESSFYYTNKQTLSGGQNCSSSDSFINLFDLLLVSLTQSYLCQSKLEQNSLCSKMQFDHFLLGHNDSIISLLKSYYLFLRYFAQIKSHKMKFQKKLENLGEGWNQILIIPCATITKLRSKQNSYHFTLW